MEEALYKQFLQYLADGDYLDTTLFPYAYKRIGEWREPLYIACPELDRQIQDAFEDFCNDYGLDYDDCSVDSEDVFFDIEKYLD